MTRVLTKAARSTGISEETARRYLKDPEVAAFIDDRTRTAADKLAITHEYVLGTIKDVIDEARVDKDFGATLKGLDQLGKHLKLFTDRQELDAQISLNVVTGVPDQEDDDPTEENEE